MQKRDDASNNCCEVMSCPVPPRPSLLKILDSVKKQVEYKCFEREIDGHLYIDPIYKELCLIIAEMYVKPSESLVRVRSSETKAGIVQEIYRELRNEHLVIVAENFSKQAHLIHKKTPYLQTALYNALFELESHYRNLVNSSMK